MALVEAFEIFPALLEVSAEVLSFREKLLQTSV